MWFQDKTVDEVAELIRSGEISANEVAAFNRYCQSRVKSKQSVNVSPAEHFPFDAAVEPPAHPRRLFICLSWIPIGKTSSHVAIVLQLSRIFQMMGFDIRIIVSGLEFTHHRGLLYYSQRTQEQLKSTQAACFQSTVEVSDLDVDFLLNCEHKAMSLFHRMGEIDAQVERLAPRECDFVAHFSGGMGCYYLASSFSRFRLRSALFMMNGYDNVNFFQSICKYCVVPSVQSPEIISRISDQGFSINRILQRALPYSPFLWELDASTSLDSNAVEAISELSLMRADFVIATMSARCCREPDPDLFRMHIDVACRTSQRVVHMFVGADTHEVRQASSRLGLSGEATLGVRWSRQPFLFLSTLAQQFRSVYYYPNHSDSAGGALIAGFSGMPVIVDPSSDAASLLPRLSLSSSYAESLESICALAEGQSWEVPFAEAFLSKQRAMEVDALKLVDVLLSD